MTGTITLRINAWFTSSFALKFSRQLSFQSCLAAELGLEDKACGSLTCLFSPRRPSCSLRLDVSKIITNLFSLVDFLSGFERCSSFRVKLSTRVVHMAKGNAQIRTRPLFGNCRPWHPGLALLLNLLQV